MGTTGNITEGLGSEEREFWGVKPLYWVNTVFEWSCGSRTVRLLLSQQVVLVALLSIQDACPDP